MLKSLRCVQRTPTTPTSSSRLRQRRATPRPQGSLYFYSSSTLTVQRFVNTAYPRVKLANLTQITANTTHSAVVELRPPLDNTTQHNSLTGSDRSLAPPRRNCFKLRSSNLHHVTERPRAFRLHSTLVLPTSLFTRPIFPLSRL